MIIVNLFGVPGAGKSTGAAYLFSQLKMKGYNVELITEFAKDLTWEKNTSALSNQVYVFGSQYYRISRCSDKVDIIITDSPLLLSGFYNHNSVLGDRFNEVVANVFNSYQNINAMIVRDKPYNPIGRNETEEEAKALQEPLINFFNKYSKTPIEFYKGNVDDYNTLLNRVLKEIGK